MQQNRLEIGQTDGCPAQWNAPCPALSCGNYLIAERPLHSTGGQDIATIAGALAIAFESILIFDLEPTHIRPAAGVQD
jgi:hypothetical protein